MKDISLGTLPPFEYRMLRAALRYAVEFCESSAEGFEGGQRAEDIENHNYWLDQASEMRAIRSRFLRAGRAGKGPRVGLG